jgi:hypothetical protein
VRESAHGSLPCQGDMFAIEVRGMNRNLLPVLVLIVTIIFCQHHGANALSTSEFESAFMRTGSGGKITPDEETRNTLKPIPFVPEEPPILHLLATGLLVLVGLGHGTKIARYLKSLLSTGNHKADRTQGNSSR